ncbi:MAG: molybdenum cofactor guanylyltransferase [Planctomycetes bacterium]|nr:molybdenum cofactor guanylyltransferase [Planctomycetota bacterium]
MGVTAVILAGGRATRMQGEKPLRLLRGRTLLEHSRRIVAHVADEVLVSSGARDLPVPYAVPDAPEFAGRGPLAGILAGLEAAKHEHTLVLACDLPNVPPPLLRRLLEALSDNCDCVYTQHSGNPEPLVVALTTAPARAGVRKALSMGVNKVLPCWDALPHRVLGEDDLAKFRPLDRTFANVNTLEDLEQEMERDA